MSPYTLLTLEETRQRAIHADMVGEYPNADVAYSIGYHVADAILNGGENPLAHYVTLAVISEAAAFAMGWEKGLWG